MISPSPQSVGQEFVRQYYTMLNTAPDFMHRFYSHDSSFIHGGHGDVSVYGQTNIHKKIVSLNFRDCHARIRQVDSLGTVDNAVVVQVSGELSNAGLPMRKFMQTFVLAPQSPKKYYVHNDIFRYQDEVFADDSCITAVTTPLIDSPQTLASSQIYSINNPITQRTQEHLSSNGIKATSLSSLKKREELQSAVTPPPPPPPPHLICSSEVKVNPQEVDRAKKKIKGEKNEGAINETLVGVTMVINHAGKDGRETKGVKSVQSTPVASSHTKTPISWAAITKKPLAIITENKCGLIDTVKIQARNEALLISQLNMEVNIAVQDSINKKHAEQKSPSDTKFHTNMTLDGNKTLGNATPEVKVEMKRLSCTSESQQHNDSFQLFVGNLPNDITAVILRETFSRFGEVFDVRINRKISVNRDVPNFGFVSFDSLRTIRKVLDARPFFLENGHRLNVEEKKSDQVRLTGNNPGVQRNKTTPSFASGRSWWGGYREGRKGFERFGGQKVNRKVRQE